MVTFVDHVSIRQMLTILSDEEENTKNYLGFLSRSGNSNKF